ncbi:MAG: hypothetical protein CMF39_01295 [Legionellaceae bacterium]|nr:hypothetical protein [Legionellaceae bacterium]
MKKFKFRTLCMIFAPFLLASCAHQDLTAPCPDSFSFGGSNSVDCDEREPVNNYSLKIPGE